MPVFPYRNDLVPTWKINQWCREYSHSQVAKNNLLADEKVYWKRGEVVICTYIYIICRSVFIYTFKYVGCHLMKCFSVCKKRREGDIIFPTQNSWTHTWWSGPIFSKPEQERGGVGCEQGLRVRTKDKSWKILISSLVRIYCVYVPQC